LRRCLLWFSALSNAPPPPTFLVWRLRTGACGVSACDIWRYRMPPVSDFSRLTVTDWRLWFLALSNVPRAQLSFGGYELWRLRLFALGGYGLALAALALVVFCAIECPGPCYSTPPERPSRAANVILRGMKIYYPRREHKYALDCTSLML